MRRLHIAGSANADADAALLADAQQVVRQLAADWVARGGTLVGGLGADPRHNQDPDLPILFDWTVAEAVLEALRDGRATAAGPLLHVRTSRRQMDAVPEQRQPIYDELVERGALELALLPDTWRSGALMRRAQSELGGVLAVFAGGAGVEDLANLYRARGLPVVPVDVNLGSSHSDGAHGGGRGLARKALTAPGAFMQMADGSDPAARLMQLAMDGRRPAPQVTAQRLVSLLADLQPPTAFCVRLLDRGHADFQDVEWYFGSVARPVLEAEGFCVVDLGVAQQERAWMQEEVFHKLHFAEAVLVDLTAGRPNCFIELGYALGRGQRTVITARAGQPMPFDIDKLPWRFWDPSRQIGPEQDELRAHINQYASRPALISPVELI
jgi:hypothetical protein